MVAKATKIPKCNAGEPASAERCQSPQIVNMAVGAINTDTEAKTLGHLKQTAYSLVGKATALFDDRCATNGPADCETITDDLPSSRPIEL